ncbi:histone family protein nucleoid-structuring protein H-NS [Burkholderia pseudomallei]|nr:histone family protein nucleoid-structuring protein H-NS [Burkholderia pseudomallei]
MLNEINLALNEFAQKQAALKAELEALEEQEKETKSRLRADVIAQTQALIDGFDIAPDEVIFTAKRTLTPKYRHPETGDTWHGYGKRPECFKGIENLDGYLIDASKKSPTATKKKGSTKAKAAAQKHNGGQVNAAATGSDHVTEVRSVESTNMASIHASSQTMPHPIDQTRSPTSTEEHATASGFATFAEHSPVFGARGI